MPALSDGGQELHGFSPEAVREAERHVRWCADCSSKLSKYWLLVNSGPKGPVSTAAAPGVDCPNADDVDWHELAAGLWPGLKAKQLIMHAASCDHCGPRLRAALSVDDATPQEEKLLAELTPPFRPGLATRSVPAARPGWQLMRWLVPAAALMLIVGVLATRPSPPRTPISGPELAEFAVSTHKQFVQGSVALDVRSDSQQTINEWFQAGSQFALAVPDSPVVPGEDRPFHLEGARLMKVAGKAVAYIAYQMQSGPVGLMVIPDSVAVASGGVELDFKKVGFHYGRFERYKVVTWSIHGLTYALVSQEGNSTQGSCMVCHSAMRDRDLTHTPTPLPAQRDAIAPAWQ